MERYTLVHWGIKGQKWGIRRYQNKDGSLTPAGKKRYSEESEDYRRVKELRKKPLHALSNAELKDLNNRLQLESQYKNLKKQHIGLGQKFVQDVAYKTAKNTASEYAKKYAKKGIEAAVNSALKKK